MKLRNIVCNAACLSLLALIASPGYGQLLYDQDFDVDDTANWFQGPGDPLTDTFVDFFFDYSTVGIPAAPNNSDPNSTRGMMLQANLFDNVFGGFSVSPTGESFTGDYVLSYDMWQSVHGVPFFPAVDIFPATGGIIQGAASGGTNLAYGGIMSTGLGNNRAGDADGVFFAATGDADSGSDYRVYSPERNISYQHNDDPNSAGFAVDNHAVYLAGTRNAASSTLYTDNFGGEVPIPSMTALFPSSYAVDPNDPTANRSGPGAIGFAWRQHTITKIGTDISWKVDGIELITLDISNYGNDFGDPNAVPDLGTNILFGYGDINDGVSANAEAFDLLFTLVDNIEVNVATAAADDADFNDDNIVDGLDFLAWQQNSGLIGGALNADGDANGDGNVDELDLGIWEGQYGSPPPLAAISAVPEPSTWMLAALAAMVGLLISQPRRAVATERV